MRPRVCALRPRLVVTLLLAALAASGATGCGDRAVGAKRSDDSEQAAPQVATSVNGSVSRDPTSHLSLGLPEDVPIPDGLRSTSLQSEEPGSLVAVFTGELEPDDVARQFSDGLRKAGWATDESRKGDELGVFARKKERIANVVVTRLSGRLHVELGLWSPRE